MQRLVTVICAAGIAGSASAQVDRAIGVPSGALVLDFDSPSVVSGPISGTAAPLRTKGVERISLIGDWTPGGDVITEGSNSGGQSLVASGGVLSVAGVDEPLDNPLPGAGFDIELRRPVSAFGVRFVDQINFEYSVTLLRANIPVAVGTFTYEGPFPRAADFWTAPGVRFDRVQIRFPGGSSGVGIDNLAAAGASAPDGPYAYSVRSNGNDRLYRISLSTGEAVDLGPPMSFGDAEGLSFGPNGEIFGIGGTVEQMWNLTSYPGALVGATGARSGGDAGLGFHEGTLYNINASSSEGTTLYRINPNTGLAQLVGVADEYCDGLAIHPRTGVAYATDFVFTDALYTINLDNGAASLVGSLDIGDVSTQSGLAFLGETLYAITNGGALFTIDTQTGKATEVAQITAAGEQAEGWEGLAIAYDGAAPASLAPFSQTFSSESLTRGYWFVAPRDFLITGLRVPDETGAGVQNVEVVRVNGGVPTFPNTTGDIESLFRAVDVDGPSIIPAGIPIREGDVVGILGAAGTTTMHNSYAPAGPFQLEIGGFTTTARRLGMQFNLREHQAQDLFTTETSEPARIEMHYLTAASLTLDGETPASGETLDLAPLSTPFGRISATGPGIEISSSSDPEMRRAGSGGRVLDQPSPQGAELSFDTDVRSLTFPFGGNSGQFRAQALDASGAVVDEFFQASTGNQEPAGPVTLAGEGIRALRWVDANGGFAPIDNVKIVFGNSCYADCTGEGDLSVFDFLCFQDAFVSAEQYADCTGEGTLNVFDFLCFQDSFVGGCP